MIRGVLFLVVGLVVALGFLVVMGVLLNWKARRIAIIYTLYLGTSLMVLFGYMGWLVTGGIW